MGFTKGRMMPSSSLTTTVSHPVQAQKKEKHTPYAGIILLRFKGTFSACSCQQPQLR